jgi:hypothetical protein
VGKHVDAADLDCHVVHADGARRAEVLQVAGRFVRLSQRLDGVHGRLE